MTRAVNVGPTITRDQVANAIKGTPLGPYSNQVYDLGVKYGVDPNLFLAVAKGESNFGLAANSNIGHPIAGVGGPTFNWTSISNALYGGSPVAGSRWGQYPDPVTGIEAFYRLITTEYLPRGQTTVESIMHGIGGSATVTGQHAFAPAFENRPSYVSDLISWMNGWGSDNPITSFLSSIPQDLSQTSQQGQSNLQQRGIDLGATTSPQVQGQVQGQTQVQMQNPIDLVASAISGVGTSIHDAIATFVLSLLHVILGIFFLVMILLGLYLLLAS